MLWCEAMRALHPRRADVPSPMPGQPLPAAVLAGWLRRIVDARFALE